MRAGADGMVRPERHGTTHKLSCWTGRGGEGGGVAELVFRWCELVSMYYSWLSLEGWEEDKCARASPAPGLSVQAHPAALTLSLPCTKPLFPRSASRGDVAVPLSPIAAPYPGPHYVTLG